MTNFITRSMTAALLLSMVFMGAPYAAFAADPAPTLTLNGEATVTLTVGETYTELGAIATDDNDDSDETAAVDISSSIAVGGDTVDTATVGTYVVTYDVTDGTTAAPQLTRTVNVVAADSGTGSSDTDDSQIHIATIDDLRNAIENQADDQTWIIAAGSYGLDRFDDITVEGQTGWYFPITANHLTIMGEGDVVIYGNEFSANGNWSTQNLVSVFGDNVSISGVTLMPKVEGNKTIEVLGEDAAISDVIIAPNTEVDGSVYDEMTNEADRNFSKEWGGSIYFNHAGNHTVQNVTIHNGGISFRYAPAGTHIDFDNVSIIDKSNDSVINGYRYSSGFNEASNSYTGEPTVTYEVDAATDNLDSVLAAAKDGDTIEFNSDLTADAAVLFSKAFTVMGNDHILTISNTGTTGGSATLGLGVSGGVTVDNLTIAADTVADNLVEVTGDATFKDVSVTNSQKAGITVLDGTLTLTDSIVLSGNTWGGIEVKNIPGASVIFASGTDLSYSISADPAFANAPAVWVDADVLATAGEFVTDDAGALADPVLSGTQTFWNVAPEDTSSHHHSSRRSSSDDNDSNDSTDTDTSGSVDAGSGDGAVLGASTYHFAANLTIGSTGEDVNQLQAILIAAGYLKITTPTGFFGPLTKAAVMAWQTAHNVPATGFVGPLTIAELNKGETPTMSDEASAMRAKQLLSLLEQLLVLLQKKAAESN